MIVGGSSLVAMLINQPNPLLVSPYLLPLYSAIFAITHLSSVTTFLLASPLTRLPLDLGLSFIDAITRTLSIVSLLHVLASHPSVPLSTSPLAHLILSALAAAGGGILASVLGVSEPGGWTLKTPAILSEEASFLSTLDLSSAGVIAVVYSLLTDLPAFRPLRTSLLAIVLQNRSRLKLLGSDFLVRACTTAQAIKTPLEARTICTLLLAIILTARVVILYARAWQTTTLANEARMASGRARGKSLSREAERRQAQILERQDVAPSSAQSSSASHLSSRLADAVKSRQGKKGVAGTTREG